MFKYEFDNTYSYYFFQAGSAAFISLVVAVLLFFITSMIVSAHQKNQHIHRTERWTTRKGLAKFGILQLRGIICCQFSSANVGYHTDKEKQSLVLELPKNLVPRKIYIAHVVHHLGRTNTWIIAPTRSGKAVNTVISTCLSYGVPY